MLFHKASKAGQDDGQGKSAHWKAELIRPVQAEKEPPCRARCPSGTDIRGWLASIAQRERRGLDRDAALDLAWTQLAHHNPLPAVLGRVCPHPCENECNRAAREGAVAIHALERYVGDWGIERGLALPRLQAALKPRRIGVVGAGPAGLSFAYQMARRGHAVTLYEHQPKPGGMLRYGIPDYRLPRTVLDAELARILDLGVEPRFGVRIGRDISLDELRSRHEALFIGIGASAPLHLRIEGEEGQGVWSGIELMERYNESDPPQLGARVVVVGGGNTAVDAARAARRLGAEVTVLYRRTRNEMPAIDEEVDDALGEGIEIHYLAAPIAVLRGPQGPVGLTVQRMAVGQPDASGRARPVPIPGDTYELDMDSLVVAVSQQSDWSGLGALESTAKVNADELGAIGARAFCGGDARRLGTVAKAVGDGRRAAEALSMLLEGATPSPPAHRPPVRPEAMHLNLYPSAPRVETRTTPREHWLAEPHSEIHRRISGDELDAEVRRCLSCGSCFGCEHCFMYCVAQAYEPSASGGPGAYFRYDASLCEGCGKCIEICPCGFLSPAID
jgi:NADPH-dependent glutamate synthase beta subunit-like oxidoreductase/Pyruvate/2-oxoacid:ferredoxin oxidoreductase delta subunit